MDPGFLELTKLLPRWVDLENVVQDEVEARYILKRAADHWANLQCSGDFGAEETGYLVCALVDRNWERIHTGHFTQVPLATRKIYAIACCFKIFFLLLASSSAVQKDACSEILDEAQLLGCLEDWSELKVALMDYLDKGAAAATDSEKLPTLEPLTRVSSTCDIPQLDAPSLEEFQAKCFGAGQPTLLLNTIQHWPALHKWLDLNYILQVAGNRTVPIEIGSNYASDEWSQQLVKIRDFLSRQFGKNTSKAGQNIEYLAQHELFSQISALKEDISIPDYCTISKGDAPGAVDIKAWLGPAGTVSPMHYDPKHNLLCQVFGSKRIILAAPEDTDNLYPHESEFLANTARIDAAQLDPETFPLVAKVKFYQLLLQPGDCLYMPPKWWHYVRSEAPSFSVSFWWE